MEQVPTSDGVAKRLLADAEAHIGLATKGVEEDPSGTLQLSYDAARKASAALLAVQGLRATTRGGHIGDLLQLQGFVTRNTGRDPRPTRGPSGGQNPLRREEPDR